MTLSHGYIPGIEQPGQHEPQVLALTGLKGSGKDEAARALLLDGWVRVAFADPLREMLGVLNPLVDDRHWCDVLTADGYEALKQIPEARRLMQVFGTEVIRHHFGTETWVDLAAAKIEGITDDGYNVVITDCRFGNEAKKVRGLLAGRVVAIHRPRPLTEVLDDDHVSEAGLPEELIDIHLTNDGSIADLHAKILEIAHAHP